MNVSILLSQINNRCAKFKMRPLEHLELMERVYFGAAATGKHTWTLTELRDDDAATAIATEDSGMGPLSVGTLPHPGHDTVGQNVVDSSLFDNALPQSTPDGSANAKRRKRPAPGTVTSIVDNLVKAVSKQSRELKIMQYIVIGKSENIVGDCLARLMSMPGLKPGGKLLSFACGIMDSPDNRYLTMSLSQDYIVNWLKEKRACTLANVGREHERDIRVFRSDGVVDMD
ncbi:hypothetical protein CsSME_00050156 [Camellia sinensis var. sinensis]